MARGWCGGARVAMERIRNRQPRLAGRDDAILDNDQTPFPAGAGGVELHATLADNVLSRQFMARAPAGQDVAVTLALPKGVVGALMEQFLAAGGADQPRVVHDDRRHARDKPAEPCFQILVVDLRLDQILEEVLGHLDVLCPLRDQARDAASLARHRLAVDLGEVAFAEHDGVRSRRTAHG